MDEAHRLGGLLCPAERRRKALRPRQYPPAAIRSGHTFGGAVATRMTTTVKASASRLVAFSLTMLLPVVSLASPPVCGDVNQSGTVTASDALEVLKKAVQQPVDLVCPAPAGPLITGQTACFDPDGGTIFCNGTREDGDVQAGVSRSYTDNGDGTITDNRTGLMWEKLSNDGSIHDRDALMAWGNAFTKIQSLNTANFAGHDDWRLPNVIELTTLVNYGTQIPAISAAFASDCPQDCTVLTCSCIGSQDPIGYWTSTTYENGSNGSGAWAILFAGGFNGAVDKSFSAYVRAVRNAD